MAEDSGSIWAIIPAAGLGTRMAENAVLGCKELVEVGGITMLERTIQEVESAGINNIVVVSSPNKPAIDAVLENRGVHIVHQNEPRGLVDAVRQGRILSGNNPCLVALPDVMFTGGNPSKKLCEKFQGDCLLTIVQTESPWADHLKDTGRVTKMDGEYILDLSRKNPDEPFPIGKFRITGRAIWTDAFWEEVEDDEVTALLTLASARKLRASIVKMIYLDVGLTVGYKYAQAIFNQ
jgi:UTP-glucose-1-phosphate uridylyltransferase